VSNDDVLTRLTTALADRYRIDRELGAGGMATVFLAHDLRHGRDVAIKVLHPDLGAALGAERFLAEVRTTARLQHPHILPLLDSGDAAGLLYYVMPVVTGETLRDRLTRERQLPVDDAVRVAREVADALGAAHALGIVHRDIKPENILLQSGHALVADFGIALAVQTASGARMTQTGLSLGTPQYMSPEQAMGERAIDARSDIYSLGAVTYEMLTGDPPFSGSSVQAIVAKVLTEKPTPPSVVRDTVGAGVEHAVLKSLAKLPADRYASAAEFSAALADHAGPPSLSASVEHRAKRARWRGFMGVGLALVAVALAASAAMFARRGSDDAFPVRFELSADAQNPVGEGVLTLDGHTIVYAGESPNGRALFIRRLDQLESRQISGTDGVGLFGAPALSPDAKWVAFIANRRKLVKVSLDGGTPTVLADVGDYGGIDWAPSGDIVLGPGVLEGGTGLLRVKSAGGSLTPLTKVDRTQKELSHQWPCLLADGKTVLFTIWFGTAEQAKLAAVSLDDGKVTRLGVTGAKALGVIDGQLLFVNADGAIMAMPFDVRGLRATGSAIPAESAVRTESGGASYAATAFVSRSGGLVFLHGTSDRRLVWVDRSGAAKPVIDAQREFLFARLSPDGRRVAATISTGEKTDLWTIDLAGGTLTPLTATGRARNPAWSPDGRRVLYASTHGGRAAFWWQSADGSGPPVLAADPPHNPWNIDLSPDGRTVVDNSLYNGSFNLEASSLDSTHATRELAASPTATDARGRFSPDGRWVAYNSDESGRAEVYVRPFADSGGRVQISTGGGVHPVWSPDGNRVYYWQGSRMMAATLTHGSALSVVSREQLFEGRYEIDFDISHDGSRFLMIESQSSGLKLVVIPNWRTELRRFTTMGGQ
jgi:serine/threonine-protein kinase